MNWKRLQKNLDESAQTKNCKKGKIFGIESTYSADASERERRKDEKMALRPKTMFKVHNSLPLHGQLHSSSSFLRRKPMSLLRRTPTRYSDEQHCDVGVEDK